MIDIQNKELCSGCGACASVCPKGCIAMVSDVEGFAYPEVNKELCIDCGLCSKRCPVLNKKEGSPKTVSALAVRAKDEQLLLKSSSGGVFSLLAKSVLAQGGVVFGAAFCEDFTLKHIYIENEQQLYKLQGSKYMQSEIGECYLQAKNFLEQGRQVLFTGTPCQIGGLYAFLDKSYKNLITQDIICHGVPSPMVWQSYNEHLQSKSGSRLSNVFFRDKRNGWKGYSLTFNFENGAEYNHSRSEDLYFRAFLSNMCLRPSCHKCAFKDKYRQSDITLADFWGIEKVCTDFDYKKGASLVIINSQKGEVLFNDISKEVILHKVDFESAIKYNSAMLHSSPASEKRESFFKAVEQNGFKDVPKLLHVSIFKKIKGKFFK